MIEKRKGLPEGHFPLYKKPLLCRILGHKLMRLPVSISETHSVCKRCRILIATGL